MPYKDLLIGRKLGNYRLERLLGRGGMASVYYGIDLQLHRPAAVKVIDDRYSGQPAYATRFMREARAMASWRHPNIPHVYQAGQEDGISYYALEYIQGQDLQKLLQRYASIGALLPLEDVLLIGRSVAAALDYAHQHGAIHRDVKPSNVLISEDGRILLTDFGLVLEVDKGTQGEVFGSPHYIAPEQARKSSQAVPQSDLYALGIMLYEMLAGQLPFQDPSPTSLALMHITVEPPAPDEINPNLGPDVAAVLLKALRKQPDERYQSGQEFIDALEGALAMQTPGTTIPVTHHLQPETLAAMPLDGVDDPFATLPAQPAAGGGVPPAGSHLPDLAQASTRPAARVLTRRSRPLAALLAAGVVVLLLALSSPFWLFGNRDRTSGEAPIDGPGTGLVLSPTFEDMIIPFPTEENDQPTPAPEPTSTRPAPTHTTAVEPTPLAEVVHQVAIATRKDDSMFLTNQGSGDLPLASIQFRSGDNRFSGSEWELEYLRPGECVSAWKEEGKPKAPDGVSCESVGKRIERSGRDKFWDNEYDVYFDGERVGSCKKNQKLCELRFVSPS